VPLRRGIRKKECFAKPKQPVGLARRLPAFHLFFSLPMKKFAPLFAALFVASALLFRSVAQVPPMVDIKKASITPEQAKQIQEVLAGAKADTYSFTYAREGKTISRAGSASFRQLSMVKAYTKAGVGDTKSVNEGLTTVSNYIKTIVTGSFNQMYPEKVRQINKILEQSTRR
jgi:hypothetical protein